MDYLKLAKKLDKLSTMVDDFNAGSGVCSILNEFDRTTRSTKLFIQLCKYSPEYSGVIVFPVKSPFANVGHGEAFLHFYRWGGGQYGSSRRAMCKFVADRCRELHSAGGLTFRLKIIWTFKRLFKLF